MKDSDFYDEDPDITPSVLYGPPEDFFSRKGPAERFLCDKTVRMIENVELTAQQWKEILTELVTTEQCDYRAVLDLIKEKTQEI
jgi:hypothetical protein